MLGELFKHAAGIIEAAAQSPFGIAALIILVSGVVCVILFHKDEKAYVRMGAFALLFVGLISFGWVVLRIWAFSPTPFTQPPINGPIVKIPPAIPFYPPSASPSRAARNVSPSTEDVQRAIGKAEDSPNDPGANNDACVTLDAFGDSKQAKGLCQKAHLLDPRNHIIAYNLARIRYKLGEITEALNLSQAIIARKPDFIEARTLLAVIRIANKEYGPAEEVLRPVLARAEKNVEVQIALGAIYIGLGRVDQAIRRFEITLQLAPDDADVHYNLGVSFHIKGVLIRAEISYQQALRIDPQHEEAHRNRDVVLAQLGRTKDRVPVGRTKDRVPDPNRKSVPSPSYCESLGLTYRILNARTSDWKMRSDDASARSDAHRARSDAHDARAAEHRARQDAYKAKGRAMGWKAPQGMADVYNAEAATINAEAAAINAEAVTINAEAAAISAELRRLADEARALARDMEKCKRIGCCPK
jgi:tetratricopeptide (TPR) repeat protein